MRTKRILLIVLLLFLTILVGWYWLRPVEHFRSVTAARAQNTSLIDDFFKFDESSIRYIQRNGAFPRNSTEIGIDVPVDKATDLDFVRSLCTNRSDCAGFSVDKAANNGKGIARFYNKLTGNYIEDDAEKDTLLMFTKIKDMKTVNLSNIPNAEDMEQKDDETFHVFPNHILPKTYYTVERPLAFVLMENMDMDIDFDAIQSNPAVLGYTIDNNKKLILFVKGGNTLIRPSKLEKTEKEFTTYLRVKTDVKEGFHGKPKKASMLADEQSRDGSFYVYPAVVFSLDVYDHFALDDVHTLEEAKTACEADKTCVGFLRIGKNFRFFRLKTGKIVSGITLENVYTPMFQLYSKEAAMALPPPAPVTAPTEEAVAEMETDVKRQTDAATATQTGNTVKVIRLDTDAANLPLMCTTAGYYPKEAIQKEVMRTLQTHYTKNQDVPVRCTNMDFIPKALVDLNYVKTTDIDSKCIEDNYVKRDAIPTILPQMTETELRSICEMCPASFIRNAGSTNPEYSINTISGFL